MCWRGETIDDVGIRASGQITRVPENPKPSFRVSFSKFKKDQRVWIIRTEEGIYALFAKCTHLGCTPRWLTAENKFKCPCHGSGFYKTGINFEGPAPRPLERLRITRAEDGQILIDKSVKYLFEKGQWDKPGAFLKV